MALPRSGTADKNIVDLSKAHRNREVAQAVRRTRDRLSSQAGNMAFDRELLDLHVAALRRWSPLLPLFLLGTAGGIGWWETSQGMASWVAAALLCHLWLALLVLRHGKAEGPEVETAKLARRFLFAHALSGLGWAHFTLLSCSSCRAVNFAVVKGAILLAAMAVTAPVLAARRGALLATFAVPVLVFALEARLKEPPEAAMAAILVAALPFLAFVTARLRHAAATILSFRSEKDGLIAELETAKSMSDEARRRAEEANLAKSRFLASMSHELRTPLNAILGFSEVMSAQVLGPMQNPTYLEYARDIHASGQHLLDLINEILDLSRIEAGRYQLNEEPVDLAGIAADCCRLIEIKARAKDIRIVQQYEDGLPRLFADGRAVRQVVLNLLSNALKFTPSGGEVRVRVGWTAGGGQYLAIRDNGPGIPPEEIPIVLSAFGQGSIAIKGAEQGTGLGLPIVQGLVAIHGGAFELHSKLREGTEAVATFPHTRVMEALPALPMSRAAGSGR